MSRRFATHAERCACSTSMRSGTGWQLVAHAGRSLGRPSQPRPASQPKGTPHLTCGDPGIAPPHERPQQLLDLLQGTDGEHRASCALCVSSACSGSRPTTATTTLPAALLQRHASQWLTAPDRKLPVAVWKANGRRACRCPYRARQAHHHALASSPCPPQHVACPPLCTSFPCHSAARCPGPGACPCVGARRATA